MRREVLLKLYGALLLTLPLLGFAWLASWWVAGKGEAVNATIVRVGTYPTELGDRPILTVRLDDGSIQQLTAPSRAVGNCVTGLRMTLYRKNSSYSLGSSGCRRVNSSPAS